MIRSLASVVLAAVVVLAMPGEGSAAGAAGASPSISMSSVSYSSQPSRYTARVTNRIPNAKVLAQISNSPGFGQTSMSCSGPGGNGVGTWTCTGPSRRLSIGSVRVRAQSYVASAPNTSSGTVSASAAVTSSFSVSGAGAVKAGSGFSVSGRFDHVSGASDYRVSARVSNGGSVVLGQSGVACSTSGTSFRCSLRSADVSGDSDTYSVTVTERASGDSRSRTVSQRVTANVQLSAPSVSVPSQIGLEQQPFSVTGSAGKAGLRVQVVVDTTSFAAPSATCTSGSSGFFSCVLGGSYGPGTHSVAVRAIDPAHPDRPSPVTTRSTVVLSAGTATPTLPPAQSTAPEPTPTNAVPAPVLTEPIPSTTTSPDAQAGGPAVVSQDPDLVSFTGLDPGYDALLMLLVIGLALAALARPGPLSVLRSGTSVAFADSRVTPAERDAVPLEDVGFGDQTGSWSFFGHEITDEWSRKVPEVLGRYSPFLARLSLDGLEIRAMFGGLWWLLPGLGTVLGIVGAKQSGFEAMPPSIGLVLAVTVLAAFDATAGFLATVAFGLLVLGDLGPSAGHGALVILGLGLLWTALPLVATAVRPFRRTGSLSWRFAWDRSADLVIVALLCAWFAHEITAAFDVLADAPTGLPAHANAVALVVLGAIAIRVGLSHLADRWWPERLRATEPWEIPDPSNTALLGGILVRGVVFAFLGHVFIGSCWQWWVGVALFVLPDLLAFTDSTIGWSWSHRLRLPTGVTEILVLVVAGLLLVTAAVSAADTEDGALRTAFVAAALAPALLGIGQTFDGTERDGSSSWRLQLAGAGVVVVLAVLALTGWNF